LADEWAPHDTRLDQVERFALPHGVGPEDVVVDGAGRPIAGGDDGSVWRWPAPPEPHEPPAPNQPPVRLADTGGRPLGLEIDPRDGSVLICDAWRGLLRLTEDGRVRTLCSEAAGRRIVFCNNATVMRDGTVLFTDSSDRYGVDAWKRDLLEHRPNGRLLAWHPENGEVEVVTERLYFPNGVALTPDESAILLVETATHRLLRVPLNSPGDPVVLADLPAYPDNLSAVGDGTYWIALPSPRVPIAERLLPHPRLRRFASLLPDVLLPHPIDYGLAAEVDSEGKVLRTLHGPAGSYCMITGVRQHGTSLWLGSLTEPAIARVSLLR
jgi:sugar lactone lactonase YvrE